MKYYSTRDAAVRMDAAEAIKMGLSRDGGLLTPTEIPQIDQAFLEGLLTASYKTPLGKWQFDATWQQNGGGRMPKPYTLADGSLSWGERYGSFGQLSMQVTRFFRRWSVYVGGENLTNFKQRNPIIGADNPWGDTFDATMVWGPMHGSTGYVGVRFNLPRGN